MTRKPAACSVCGLSDADGGCGCTEHGPGESTTTSLLAVVTLDEAHAQIAALCHEHNPKKHRALTITAIGESGGTVGPLPDETVITVEPRTIVDLAVDAGYTFAVGEEWDTAKIVAAFNAAQETRA